MRLSIGIITLLFLLSIPTSSKADKGDVALAAYGHGMVGAYSGVGGGVRLRYEFADWIGAEVFLEYSKPYGIDAAEVHDIPNGFSLFIPIRLTEKLRLLPKFGFCDVISLGFPEEQNPTNTVHIGMHVDLGIEYRITKNFGVFFDVRALGYVGNRRVYGAWMERVSGDFELFGFVQGLLGVELHHNLLKG